MSPMRYKRYFRAMTAGDWFALRAMQFVHRIDLRGTPNGDGRRDHGDGDDCQGRGCQRSEAVRGDTKYQTAQERDAAQLPSIPIATPINDRRKARHPAQRRMARRGAPKAMRMAISSSRTRNQ